MDTQTASPTTITARVIGYEEVEFVMDERVIPIVVGWAADGTPQTARDLAYMMKDIVDNMFLVLGNVSDGKANLTVMISENLNTEKGLNAGQIIREIAKEIQGGGGGQPHFATAGGKNPAGLEKAFEKAKEFLVKA